MLVAVLAAGFARQGATAYSRTAATVGPASEAPRSALGSMNSFALGLLLGGLRGPLVMFLWSTSESQKADKNLEDFDTKVEWIRLLQPEFDTVHLYQIWNKAYNISVQMAGLPNRYAAIVDALVYADRVDQGRPDNLNILNQIAQVYSNKLGTVAQERFYYRRRVREDSMWRVVTGPKFGEDGYAPRRLPPLLDPKGNILPEYLVVRHPRPADLPPDAEWNTGEELQYLKQYEPFKYGVSTFALAYNYAKRAEVLMNVGRQKPLQVADNVIDRRPALELRAWGEEEWERGRRAEMQALGVKEPAGDERIDLEMPTADVAPTAKLADPAAVTAAVDAYRTAVRVFRDAKAEYERHLKNPQYAENIATFSRSHLQELDAMARLVTADAAYLRAIDATDPGDRDAFLATAAAEYRRAAEAYELIILEHYIEDELAQRLWGGSRSKVAGREFTPRRRTELLAQVHAEMAERLWGDTPPPGVKFTPEGRADLLARIHEAMRSQPDRADQHASDRADYEVYLRRIDTRLQFIGRPLGGTGGGSQQ